MVSSWWSMRHNGAVVVSPEQMKRVIEREWKIWPEDRPPSAALVAWLIGELKIRELCFLTLDAFHDARCLFYPLSELHGMEPSKVAQGVFRATRDYLAIKIAVVWRHPEDPYYLCLFPPAEDRGVYRVRQLKHWTEEDTEAFKTGTWLQAFLNDFHLSEHADEEPKRRF